MCYPSSNITYCIACLLCIGVILLNKFNSIQFNGNVVRIPNTDSCASFFRCMQTAMDKHTLWGQVLRNAMGWGGEGVSAFAEKHYEDVRFNVISVTWCWVGVKYPEKSVT